MYLLWCCVLAVVCTGALKALVRKVVGVSVQSVIVRALLETYRQKFVPLVLSLACCDPFSIEP